MKVMKSILNILLFTCITIVLCGCGVTRTLNFPGVENSIECFPESYAGSWHVLESTSSGDKFFGELSFTVSDKDESGRLAEVEFSGRGSLLWPPLFAVIFSSGENRYFAVLSDTGKLLRDNGYDTEAGILFQPVFLLFELHEKSAEELEINLLTFTRKENDSYIPVNDKVKLSGGTLVLNESSELDALLSSGSYEIVRRFRLEREQSSNQPE